MRVLIVDDEQDLCFVMAIQLQRAGHDVVTFHSAIEAQLFFENDQADVIVCDFQMPKMNGLEFFKWVRSQNINAPFFILTGEAQTEASEFLNIGLTGVLQKPEDLMQIPDILNKLHSAKLK